MQCCSILFTPYLGTSSCISPAGLIFTMARGGTFFQILVAGTTIALKECELKTNIGARPRMPFHCLNVTIGHASFRRRSGAAHMFRIHCSVSIDPSHHPSWTPSDWWEALLGAVERRAGNLDQKVHVKHLKIFPTLSSQVMDNVNMNLLLSSDLVGQALS